MNSVKYQWQLFLLALSFFSRIPVAHNLPYSSQRMQQCGRYFPMVGAVIAALCYLSFSVLAELLPSQTALFFMIVISLLLTGAFHEDGLADMSDGIGGALSGEKRLEIMKDSRIGTYGAVSLFLALLGKFVLLTSVIEIGTVPFGVVIAVGYISSRSIAASMIFNTTYVSNLNQSKSKSVAQSQSARELGMIVVCGAIPIVFLPFTAMLLCFCALLLCRYLFKSWLMRRIGGYTGDCLGALQQISELMIYTILVACFHNQWI
jgi:adenosylcobinamide-GDP ribazoletransferase